MKQPDNEILRNQQYPTKLIAMKECKILGKIGEGRYGKCFLAEFNGEKVIIKKYKNSLFKKRSEKEWYESLILSRLNHPSIPKFLGLIEESKYKALILERKTGITVEDMLFKKKHIFSRKEIYNIGKQLILIICYLHKNNIVHRDIRIPNVLIEGNKVFLIDFGLARFADEKSYTKDTDFSYLGDFLLYLLYSAADIKKCTNKPWYDELAICEKEKMFIKKLLRLEKPYNSIEEIESDFNIWQC